MLAWTAWIQAWRSFSDSACSIQLLRNDNAIHSDVFNLRVVAYFQILLKLISKVKKRTHFLILVDFTGTNPNTLTWWEKPPQSRTSSHCLHRVWLSTASGPPPPPSVSPVIGRKGRQNCLLFVKSVHGYVHSTTAWMIRSTNQFDQFYHCFWSAL